MRFRSWFTIVSRLCPDCVSNSVAILLLESVLLARLRLDWRFGVRLFAELGSRLSYACSVVAFDGSHVHCVLCVYVRVLFGVCKFVATVGVVVVCVIVVGDCFSVRVFR